MDEKKKLRRLPKRILSFVLTLAMVLTLMPSMSLTVMAADEHNHSGWTEWTTDGSLPTAAGSYYLGTDITLTNTWTVPKGEVNLCLNDHVVKYTGDYPEVEDEENPGTLNGSVIMINDGSTLNLYDCGTTAHNFTVDADTGVWKLTGNNGADSGTKSVIGGVITGGIGTWKEGWGITPYAGGVYINGGTLNMYGGHIAGNKAALLYNYDGDEFYIGECGGVYLEQGRFSMYGGSVVGNVSGNECGGGLYVNLDTNLSIGGTAVIKDNCKLETYDDEQSRFVPTPCDVYFVCNTYYEPYNSTHISLGTGDYAPAEGMEVYIYNVLLDGGRGRQYLQVFVAEGATAEHVKYFKADHEGNMIVHDNGRLKMIPKPSHNHSFSYTVDGNTIKAYCTQTSGAAACSYQGSASDLSKAVSLTLSASSANYSGSTGSSTPVTLDIQSGTDNANTLTTENFGTPTAFTSGATEYLAYNEFISTTGYSTWSEAKAFVAALNAARYDGHQDWQLLSSAEMAYDWWLSTDSSAAKHGKEYFGDVCTVWSSELIDSLEYYWSCGSAYGYAVYASRDADTVRNNAWDAEPLDDYMEAQGFVVLRPASSSGSSSEAEIVTVGTEAERTAWKDALGEDSIPEVHYVGKAGSSTTLEDTTTEPTTKGHYTAKISAGTPAVTATIDFDIIDKHAHSFTYSANGATLTATCGTGGDLVEACDLEQNKVELTLSASDENCSGNPVEPTITFGNDTERTAWNETGIKLPDATGDGAPTITKTYYATDASGNKTGSALDGVPSASGKYIVDVKVSYGADKEATVSLPYEILEPKYLTFTAEEANASMLFNWSNGDGKNVQIKVSSTDVLMDGENAEDTDWHDYMMGTNITFPSVGDSVSFKGSGVITSAKKHFSISNGKIAASGDVTSLTNGTGGNETLEGSCYNCMFKNCTGLTSAPALPATTLADSCYMSMFEGCTGLSSAPALPATTLTISCYASMFSGCTGLSSVPALAATTLASGCYKNMFSGCTSLKVVETSNASEATWKFPAQVAERWNYQMIYGLTASGTLTDVEAGKMYKVSPAHEHAFTYTVSGAKLTATSTCHTQEGCVFNSVPKTVELTLTASSANYSGNTPTIQLGTDEEKADWEAAGLSPLNAANLKYYKSTGEGSITRADNDEVDASAIDAGNYVAEYTIDTAVAKVAVKILPTPLTKEQLFSKLEGKYFYDTTYETVVFYRDGSFYIVGAKSHYDSGTDTALAYKILASEYTSLYNRQNIPSTMGLEDSYDYMLDANAKQSFQFNINDEGNVESLIYKYGEDARGTASLYGGSILDFNTNFYAKLTRNFSADYSGTSLIMKAEGGAIKIYYGTTPMESITGFDVLVPLPNNRMLAMYKSGYFNKYIPVVITCDSTGDISKIVLDNRLTFSQIHEHNWQYSATGNMLEAYCASADCPSGTSATNKVSLTLTATSQNYSGSTTYAASLGDTTAWTGARLSVPTIKYYKATNAGGTEGTEEVTNRTGLAVGNYYAAVTVGDGDNQATAKAAFKIMNPPTSVCFWVHKAGEVNSEAFRKPDNYSFYFYKKADTTKEALIDEILAGELDLTSESFLSYVGSEYNSSDGGMIGLFKENEEAIDSSYLTDNDNTYVIVCCTVGTTKYYTIALLSDGEAMWGYDILINTDKFCEWSKLEVHDWEYYVEDEEPEVIYVKCSLDEHWMADCFWGARISLTATAPNFTGIEGLNSFNSLTKKSISENDVELYKVNEPDITTGGTKCNSTPTEDGYYYAKLVVEEQVAVKSFVIHNVHIGVKQDGQSATCTEDGWNDYYKCSETTCNKLFVDSTCTTEITALDEWKTGDGKITALGHAWGYSADGAKITATCNRNGSHKATLTLTAGDANYSGNAYDGAGLDSVAWEDACLDVPTIKYAGTGDTTYTESTTAPTAVGTYEARITVGTATAVKTFSITDEVAPTAEISIDTNKWSSFLNTITFGMFFKETKNVTITASDSESGVKKIEYYVSSKALTEAEVKALTSWTAYSDAFSISDDANYVIYAKVTDKSGNITYVSSDGVVIDTTAPVFTGIEDEKTYCGKAEFTVIDSNLDTVKVDGTTVTPIDGKYIITGDDADHTVVVNDKAGNSATCTITVKKNHTGGTATCQKKAVCEVCEKEYGELADHVYATTYTEDKAATCTEKGSKSKHCTTEGCTSKSEVTDIDPLGHVGGIVTCQKKAICTRCEKEYGEKLNHKDDHSATKQDGMSANCTTAGYKDYYKCTCGSFYEEEACTTLIGDEKALEEWKKNNGKISILGHEKGTHHDAVTATCMEKGNVEYWDCARQGCQVKIDNDKKAIADVQTQIDENNHKEKAISYEYTHTTHTSIHVCCKKVKEEAVEHTYGKEGEARYTCTVCSYEDVAKKEQIAQKEVLEEAKKAFESYKTSNITAVGKLAKTGDSTAAKKLITDAKAAIKAVAYNESKSLSDNKKVVDNIVSKLKTALVAQRKADQLKKNKEAFESYKTSNITAVGKLVKSDDTDVAKKLITDAKAAIKAVAYNESRSLLDNKKVVDNIVSKLKTNLNKQRQQDKKNKFAIDAGFKVTTGKQIKIKWGKVAQATGYEVYLNYCGVNNAMKLVRTLNKVDATTTSIAKINGKAVDQTQHIKVYVRAYKLVNGKKTTIAKTLVAHAVGGKNKEVTDAKDIKLKKTAYSLNVGKTVKIAATIVKKNPKLKILSHTSEFRYSSTDTKVATVDANGKIKAKAKGSCDVYVYAVNGNAKKITVKVS